MMNWANVVNFVRIDKFFPCHFFDGFSRARISRFSFFLFTSSPTPRNHLLLCELGVKTLLRGTSPLLHPTSAQKVPAATTCIARFRMVNFV